MSFGELQQPKRAFAKLNQAPSWSFEGRVPDALDGVNHHKLRRVVQALGDDRFNIRLGSDPHVLVAYAQSSRAHAELARRLLAGNIDDRLPGAGERPRNLQGESGFAYAGVAA